MAAVLSFAESGRGFSHNLTLEAVANTAIELGFEKDGPQSSSKKPAQRADLQRFFKAYGVKAFSPFREKFEKEKLLPPEEYAALKVAQEIEAKENEFAPVTEQQYVEATQTADTLEKKWRLFKKPGGVGVKSDLYYDCRGARSQVETGDIATECPQWNDIGAVDYVGKAAWMGHNKLKGRTKDQARAMFVKLFQDAVADKKAHFYP